MLKAVIIIGIVVAVIIGGLLTLRSSTRTGMPDEATLGRAQKRAREIESAEKSEPDQ